MPGHTLHPDSSNTSFISINIAHFISTVKQITIKQTIFISKPLAVLLTLKYEVVFFLIYCPL